MCQVCGCVGMNKLRTERKPVLVIEPGLGVVLMDVLGALLVMLGALWLSKPLTLQLFCKTTPTELKVACGLRFNLHIVT